MTDVAECGCVLSMPAGKNARATPANPPPGLLTMKQAVELTGLTRWTIEKFEANEPSFPKRIAPTFSRVRRFRRVDLVRWLEGNTTAAKGLTS